MVGFLTFILEVMGSNLYVNNSSSFFFTIWERRGYNVIGWGRVTHGTYTFLGTPFNILV